MLSTTTPEHRRIRMQHDDLLADRDRFVDLKGAALENAKEQCKMDCWVNNPLDSLGVRTYTKPRFSTKSAVVRVDAGAASSEETFFVHEALLTAHSDFFAAALSKDWKEAQQKLVTLPDEDAVFFEIFTNFVYSGYIHSTEGQETTLDAINDLREDLGEYGKLAHCWITGDKLIAPRFQDGIADAIFQKVEFTPGLPIDLPGIAYAKTTGDNPLKRLAVDIAVRKVTDEDMNRANESLPGPQFYFDLIPALCERGDERRKEWTIGPCDLFHLHHSVEWPGYRPYAHSRPEYRCYYDSVKVGGCQ